MRNTSPLTLVSLMVLHVLFCVDAVAAPKVLAICGASEGYSYFLPGGANLKTHGWVKDGISNGQLVLVRDKSGFDIVFPGLDGQATSVRTQGGQVVLYGSGEDMNEFILGVSYKSGLVVETYLFRFSDAKNGEVLFTKLHGGGMVPKGHLFNAKCRR